MFYKEFILKEMILSQSIVWKSKHKPMKVGDGMKMELIIANLVIHIISKSIIIQICVVNNSFVHIAVSLWLTLIRTGILKHKSVLKIEGNMKTKK